MDRIVLPDRQSLGRRSAEDGAESIRRAIRDHGAANIILATGASQFETLEHLSRAPDITWNRVTAFHLDEYIGLPITHPASFRKYLWERFHRLLPIPLRAFHYIDGQADPEAECERLGRIMDRFPIDVAFIGIGENGHLAFNDPPADFTTERPYLIVELDDACRRQQQGEGWFPTLEDVPRRAISMSVRRILRSGRIICTVPDRRKAAAVQAAVEGPLTPDVPASILREHPATTLYLDSDAASLLSGSESAARGL